MEDGELILNVGGQKLGGWTRVRVTRGIERCPSDFDIEVTEKDAGGIDVVVQPGQACTVTIGGDLVVTGYVDRYMPEIEKDRHSVRIVGRGKCEDLVDCSAEWKNGQITGSTVLGIAQKLAKPYGLTVSADTDTGTFIPQFNLMLGETSYEIIERICRYKALLAYERPDGSLLLTIAGNKTMSSGVKQGENVQRAMATYAMDQRYSDIVSFRQGVDQLGDAGNGGNTLGDAKDPSVKRHRQLDIICESASGGPDVVKLRAIWEAARRAGRGSQLQVTVDSWRDGDGNLWEPNTIIPVDIPALKTSGDDWTIATVTYRRDEDGTHADLTIMPKAAFVPEPLGPPLPLLDVVTK